MKVIPVINCHANDLEGVQRNVHLYEEFSEWVHLDAADGIFTFNKSWANPHEWLLLHSPLKLEVHLMVEHPENMIDIWIKAGAKRIIFHLEAVNAWASPPSGGKGEREGVISSIVQTCTKYGVEAMLATNHETPPSALEPYLGLFTAFQMLAVHPGPAGQQFLPVVLEKISFLRSRLPHATIEVDGGMVPETARRVKEAGADTVAVASYILNSNDPKSAYKELAAI